MLFVPRGGDGPRRVILLEWGVHHGRPDAVQPRPLVVRPRNLGEMRVKIIVLLGLTNNV